MLCVGKKNVSIPMHALSMTIFEHFLTWEIYRWMWLMEVCRLTREDFVMTHLSNHSLQPFVSSRSNEPSPVCQSSTIYYLRIKRMTALAVHHQTHHMASQSDSSTSLRLTLCLRSFQAYYDC